MAMHMQDQTDQLRIFVTAADSGSFREAAVRLGIAPQAVTRAIQRLEAHYAELLFHRSTRQIRLTGFGEHLAARCRPALAQLDALWQPDHDRHDATGLVRVSAPHSLGLRAVLPAARQLAISHPGVHLDIRLSDRISDAVDTRLDVGIRVGQLRDSRVVARRAGRMRLHVVAAPALIARAHAPRRPEDLRALPVVASLDGNTGRPWPWYFRGGRHWVPTAPALTVDDADLEMQAAIDGLAFAQLADYMAAPLIASGALVHVLADAEPAAWDLSVYRPQRGPVPARVRVVFDALLAAMRALPTLDTSAAPP